jgi:hypothetical protein
MSVKENVEERTKIQLPDGRLVSAIELEYEPTSEPWTILTLSDGSTMRVRMQIEKVFRTEDYNPMTGEPGYIFTSQNQVRVQVPQKLKKYVKPIPPGNQEIV